MSHIDNALAMSSFLREDPQFELVSRESPTSKLLNIRGGSEVPHRRNIKKFKSRNSTKKKDKTQISKSIKQDASAMIGDAIRYVKLFFHVSFGRSP